MKRLPPTPSLASVLGALVCCAGFSGAVGCQPKCDTATPCEDALIIGMPASGEGTYTLTFDSESVAGSCELTLDAEGGGSQSCSDSALNVGSLDGDLWLYVRGTPGAVVIRLEKAGAQIFEQELNPQYKDLRADSRNCVACQQAEYDFTTKAR